MKRFTCWSTRIFVATAAAASPNSQQLVNLRRSLFAFCLPAFSVLFIVSGCSAPEQVAVDRDDAPEQVTVESDAPAADQQTAFRVRSDFTAGLNADQGWAGALNENVTVNTDEPFRIRFELESSAAANDERRFRLQYRRNGGEWTNVDAESFPKPEKELDLDFENYEGGEITEDWSVVLGNASDMEVAEDEFLQVRTNQEPLLAIGLYEANWEPTEFAAVIRLPNGNQSGTGIIFGYVDPENYCCVYLDPAGTISVSRFVDGEETAITEKNTSIPTGQWHEVAIQPDNSEAEIDFDDGVLEFTADVGAAIPPSQLGFYVPANSTAEFREFGIAGEARTPRVSVIASEAYENGEETTDLLAGSSSNFVTGAGISLDYRTIPWSVGNAQSEWEWPLVIRRLSDGALVNNGGDTFEFRMVDSDNNLLASYKNPTLTLSVPSRHVGGTFVETPGRIGPWQASNGDLYFIMEPAETDNVLLMMKSTDYGASWHEVDGANRPEQDDLEGFASDLSTHTIHMLHQQTNETWHHSFRTSDHPTHPDTWDIRDHLVATQDDPPTQVATMAVRSDGSIVAVYGGPRKVHYKIRPADGIWGDEEVTVDPDNDLILSDPQVVLGADDEVHLAYYGNNGTAWYRRILPDGSMTSRELLSTELADDRPNADKGSILPLVFIPDTNTVVVIYQLETGTLWERRVTENGSPGDPVQVSDRKVVHCAIDSDQAGADAIAHGTKVHVLFIEDDTGSIYHTRTNDFGEWQPSTLLVDRINGSWVRGTLLTRDDSVAVYGYVYDAGSEGGSGMKRYGEVP